MTDADRPTGDPADGSPAPERDAAQEQPRRAGWKRILGRLRLRRQRTEPGDATFERAREADERLVFSLARSRFPNLKQLRFLPEFLTVRERRIVLSLLLVAGVSLLIVGGRFLERHVALTPRAGGTYTEAIVGQPRFVNPVLAGTSSPDADLTRLVFSGLMKLSGDGSFVPDLAERLDVNDERTVYTATLRTGLRWQDDEDLTVDDVLFTFETIQDPKFLSPVAGSFHNVTVERIDDRTVRFTLKEASTMFPSQLTVGILPQHLWTDVQPTSFALSEYNLRPIGSGPFQFTTLTKNNRSGEVRSYSLSRAPSYHGPKPYLDEMTFKFYPTEEEALTALRDGKVLGVSFLSHARAATLRGERRYTINELPLAQTVGVFLSSRFPAFKTKEVRQALAMAVDRERILKESMHDFGEIVDAPATPQLSGRRDDLRHASFDPAAANDLLERNGWVRGSDGIRKKGSDQLAFTLTTADDEGYRSMASMVRENWTAIGVKVDVKEVDVSQIQKDVIRPRDYQALLFAEGLGSSRDLFPFWHSTQIASPGLNLSIFINKEVDQLLEDARKSPPDVRDEKYRRVQQILADEQPAVFLFQLDYPYVAEEDLRGVTSPMIVQSGDRFANVEAWYLRTKLGWK